MNRTTSGLPAIALAAVSVAFAVAGDELDDEKPLHPQLAEQKAAVEAYAKCMDKYLGEDDDRTVEDGRLVECNPEYGRMKASIPEPEWERALALIEDAIPEIKERREGK